MKNKKWTGNQIGDEGASAISESLKINTTLTELNLDCDETKKQQMKNKRKMKSNKKWTDNQIGDEGRTKLSEALNTNTTLTVLVL